MKSKLKALWENWYFDNPVELFCCRLFGRRTGLTVYRKGEWRVLIDHIAGDQSGTKECLVSPMYRDLLAHVEISKRPRILDVGGNGGGFVLLCRELFGELGETVSIEFNPDTFRRLWFNLKSNVSNDIVVLNAAAAGADGSLTVADEKGSTSAKAGVSDIGSREVKIETITLDTVLKRFPAEATIDLCKIDIEGAEFDFLLSEYAVQLSRIQNLIIEIHPVEGRATGEIESRFSEVGLELVATANEVHGDVRLYSRH